jgi:hypothetical protein
MGNLSGTGVSSQAQGHCSRYSFSLSGIGSFSQVQGQKKFSKVQVIFSETKAFFISGTGALSEARVILLQLQSQSLRYRTLSKEEGHSFRYKKLFSGIGHSQRKKDIHSGTKAFSQVQGIIIGAGVFFPVPGPSCRYMIIFSGTIQWHSSKYRSIFSGTMQWHILKYIRSILSGTVQHNGIF